MQSRLLIVDDDREMREVLGTLLSSEGQTCELAANATAALKIVEDQTFDVVVCDVVMDGMSGLDLLDRLRRTHPALPFIVITGKGDIPQAIDAIRRGAFEYVTKPCDADALRRVVTDALEGRRRPSASLRVSPPVREAVVTMVGSGPAMRALQNSIDFVARSSAPVLITGETGVGKELAARAIHARSERRERPFVAVNTSAIPSELLEGELFGHVRGGFTGAVAARKGLFTEADGGTLLLDEIGDMSFDLQAKLLRVVQFGDIRPVGGDRVHHVDVRILASTHRDLPALVKAGTFREDLYFRLDVLSVPVPPLRDRREDIPALAAYFLAEACRRAPRSPVRSIGREALDVMTRSPWPGNIRELASRIERAVVFGVDEMLDSRQLGSLDAAPPSTPDRWPAPDGAPWTLRTLSNAYTVSVLAACGGNKEQAAHTLGIDLSTLYRWQRAQKS
ncbi:MAG TPA: sigma-54 dependent transcriptional regulator [Polyangiaceae bacterium]